MENGKNTEIRRRGPASGAGEASGAVEADVPVRSKSGKKGAPPAGAPPASRSRRLLRLVFLVFAAGWVAGWALGHWPGRAAGLGMRSPVLPAGDSDVHFLFRAPGLADETDHSLAGALGELLDSDSIEIVLADLGGLPPAPRRSASPNPPSPDGSGKAPPPFPEKDRPGSTTSNGPAVPFLVKRLLAFKKKHPAIWMLVLADPACSGYTLECPTALKPLVDAGAHVLLVDTDQVPDSDLLLSPFYRLAMPVVLRAPALRNRTVSFGAGTGMRSPRPLPAVLRRWNGKPVRRRMLLVRENDRRWRGVVGCLTPGAPDSNALLAALALRAPALAAAARSELLLARSIVLRSPQLCFSRADPAEIVREIEARLNPEATKAPAGTQQPGPLVQCCAEESAGEKVDWMLAGAGSGDTVTVVTRLCSDPAVVRGLRAAAQRGAAVRILMPGSDSGNRSIMPNRVVGTELRQWAKSAERDLEVRWLAGGACRGMPSWILVQNKGLKHSQLLLCGAPFSKKGLRGAQLNMAVYVENAAAAAHAAAELDERLWAGEHAGAVYSLDYDCFALSKPRLFFGRLVLGWCNACGACRF